MEMNEDAIKILVTHNTKILPSADQILILDEVNKLTHHVFIYKEYILEYS